jgi:hypothetical protein
VSMRGLKDVFILTILVVAIWVYVLHALTPETTAAFRALPTPTPSDCVALDNARITAERQALTIDELNALNEAECP